MTPWKERKDACPNCGEQDWPTVKPVEPVKRRDVCPECGEEDEKWIPKQRCICHDPMYIAIPPGKHIHIQCPVHGDVKIYGPRVTWMAMKGSSVSYAART